MLPAVRARQMVIPELVEPVSRGVEAFGTIRA